MPEKMLLIFGALSVYVILSILNDPYPLLKRKEHVKGHGLQRTKQKKERQRKRKNYKWGSYVTK